MPSFASMSRAFRDPMAVVPRLPPMSNQAISLFVALYHYLWGSPREEAWPTQRRLAADFRISERTVRTHSPELVEAGVVDRVKVPRGKGLGGFRYVYRPGPALLVALAAMAAAAAGKRPLARGATGKVRRSHAAGFAGDLDPFRSSSNPSSSPEPAPTPAPPSEEKLDVDRGESDRAIAVELLVEHRTLTAPGKPPPRAFDVTAIALVALRLGELEADPATKRAKGRAALRGAVAASKDRPPAVRYVFGSQEHFEGNVDRGEALLRREEALRRTREEVKRATVRVAKVPIVEQNRLNIEAARRAMAACVE